MLINLFVQAHIVVKLVMIGLLAASVWSWAIIFQKLALLARVRRETGRFERLFWSGQSLEDLYLSVKARDDRPAAAVFMAAMREWKRGQDTARNQGIGGVRKRIDKVMDIQLQKQMSNLESHLLFLATVGSTAPFIGLFGTVWGIMTSFQSIAMSKNTNLTVVAPGVAEALAATALGLVAAIPAVIFYNKFSADLARIGARLENFTDEFSAIISRQLEEKT
ncbi:MAG: protein TolQ [Hyphomicrobiales bacterium]